MNASRELDVKIAKLVGYNVDEGDFYDPKGKFVDYLFSDTEGDDCFIAFSPKFSTDLNQAFTLIPSLEESAVIDNTFELRRNSMGQWSATFGIDVHSRLCLYFQASAMTPALAICAAWLKWQEEKNKNAK